MNKDRVKMVPAHPGDHDSCFTCNLQLFDEREGIFYCPSEMNQDKFPDDCPFNVTEDEARDV